MSSVNLFCWLQLQYWWVFHSVSKGPRTSSLDLLCLGRRWVARQTTYLHRRCLSSQPQLLLQFMLQFSSSGLCSGDPCWLYLPLAPLCLLPLNAGGAGAGAAAEQCRLPAGWCTGYQEPPWAAPWLLLYMLSSPRGAPKPQQCHRFLNSSHLFLTFLTAWYFKKQEWGEL